MQRKKKRDDERDYSIFVKSRKEVFSSKNYEKQ